MHTPTSSSPIVAPNTGSFISAWIALFFLIALGTSSAHAAHTFANTGALGTARVDHTATLLHNGLVLVAGGNGIDSAELYDPATGAWSATGSLATARGNHTATVLPNGKILVVGGSSGLASAEIYDPATGTWSATGSLATGRFLHSATLLPNGKVLVAGGFNFTDNYLTSAELYDPTTGTWSATGAMAAARGFHPATLLANGKLLVAGGFDGSSLTGVELYDPALGTWSATGSLAAARGFHTSILLPDGQILVAGGNDGPDLASAELYDPVTGMWSGTGALTTARREHSVSLLPEGKILISGGFTGGATAELYDPVAGTWSATGSLVGSRRDHTSTILPNGKVLVAAGSNGGALATAEIYDPSAPASGTWSATGSLNKGYDGRTATLLPDGKVLAAGGKEDFVDPIYSELFDPSTGTWTEDTRGSLTQDHTSTLMADGKVLLAGGTTYFGLSPPLVTGGGKVYDPIADSWKTLEPYLGNGMATARSRHTATLLPDGRVLVVGGKTATLSPLASTELFDPGSVSIDPDFDPSFAGFGTWSTTGSLATGRHLHTATLLRDGKVLVVGGDPTGNSGGFLATAEVYNPAAGTWSATGSLAEARHLHSATLLPNGKVLVVGGRSAGGGIGISSAELYDPDTGMWIATGSLSTGRINHTATLMPDGRVLVTGGSQNSFPFSSSELYDPATGTWTVGPALGTGRASHTATLLPSGKVLVAGNADTSAELYDPGFGFSPASRPQIASAVLDASGRLVLTGSGFRGISGATGGNGAQNSPTNHPVVEWRGLENNQSVYLLSDPAVPVSDTAFTSVDLRGQVAGIATVTVIANGIRSEGILSPPLSFPAIFLQQPAGTFIGDGSTSDFGTLVVGDSPSPLSFTIQNPGYADLTGLGIVVSGTDAADFTVTANPAAPLSPGGSTAFTVQFAPGAGGGAKSAALHIANNSPLHHPFEIILIGTGLSFAEDGDLDGLNDASEFRMAALGFDWQVDQTTLVDLYYDNANDAGLFTSQQVQAIHVGTPLIARDPLTSEFTITFGLKKSTDLMSFSPFPFVAPNTSINGGGNLEFKFTSPDDAAFFLLEAE